MLVAICTRQVARMGKSEGYVFSAVLTFHDLGSCLRLAEIFFISPITASSFIKRFTFFP